MGSSRQRTRSGSGCASSDTLSPNPSPPGGGGLRTFTACGDGRLAGTLSEYFGRPLKLEIELTDNAGVSVAMRDAIVKDEKQAAAEADFMADPAVQVLLTEGQGRIRAGSIQAND